MAEQPAQSRLQRLGSWLRSNAESRWLPAVLPVFPALDFIAPVMPNQLLLIGLSAAAVGRWVVFAAAFMIGTSLGGMLVAYAVQSAGMELGFFLDPADDTASVTQTVEQFRLYGLWFLALVALLPTTPRLTVVACALAGFAPIDIGGMLLMARSVPAMTLSAIGAFGPRFALQLPFIGHMVERAAASLRAS